MARLTGKALAEDIANTVLEDSEPERQAEESTRKQQERHRREPKRNEETGPEASGQVVVVVEGSTSSPLSISKVIEPSVIEISGMISVYQMTGGMNVLQLMYQILQLAPRKEMP
jgi:hypothetical protein